MKLLKFTMQLSAQLAAAALSLCVLPAYALTFSGDLRVSNVSGLSLNPRVAAANGNLHLVWQEAVNGGQPYAIFYARSTNNGTTWEGARQVSSGASAFWPEVAVSGSTVNVFWSTDPTAGDVFQVRSTDNGTSFGGVVNLTNSPSLYSRTPRAVAQGNNVHLVYYEPVGGAGRARYALSCNGGASFGSPIDLSDTAGDIDDETLTVVVDQNGVPTVSFRSSRDGNPQGGWPPFSAYVLKGRSVDCNSQRASFLFPAQRLSEAYADSGGDVYGVSLTSGAQGRMHLTYFDSQSGTVNAMYRPLRAYGWDAPKNLSNFAPGTLGHSGVTAEHAAPLAVEDSKGRVHTFFVGTTGFNADFPTGSLIYRESGEVGASTGTTFGAAATLATGVHSPAAIAHNGRVHIFWSDFRDNNTGQEIYHKFANDDGSTAVSTGDTDKDGIPDNVEAVVGRNPLVKDNDVFSNNQLFAMQQYRDFLSREGEAGGVNFWTQELNAGRQTRQSMVVSFTTSGEFDTLVAPMARLYFGTFLRIPDYPGLLFWTDEYRSGRRSLINIAEAFATVPEFTNRYGNIDNAGFVNLLYQNILQRAPDQAGLNFWVGEINSGRLTRGGMLAQFTESDEFKARRRAEIFTTLIFAGMLRRAPDEASFNAFVQSPSNEVSALAIINSAEYRSRFLP
jgi:Domain of unknown function (DUF4214)